jgi:hypothetical protein
MRVLVQRVLSASVSVDGAVVGQISPGSQGLLALVGVTHTDTADVARRMADKLWALRQFGCVNRFHAERMVGEKPTVFHHSASVALILIELMHNPSANLLRAAILHDLEEGDGEFGQGLKDRQERGFDDFPHRKLPV